MKMKQILSVLIFSIVVLSKLSGQCKECVDLIMHIKSENLKSSIDIINQDACCIDYVDSAHYGYTPLMYAMEKREKRIIRKLIDKDVKVDVLTLNTIPSYDAFYIAVKKDFLWGVKKMVKEGFNYHRTLDDSENVSFTCARNNSIKTLRYLIRLGIDNNLSDEDYFEFGSTHPIDWAAMENNPRIIKIFIKNGVNIEQKGSYGYTPLMSACSVYEPANDAIKLLLNRGANPDASTINGYSALMMTCSNRNLIGSKLLVQNGADLNLVTDEGNSALHYCVRYSKVNVDLIKMLIANGIDKTLKDSNGQTAYDIAKENKLDNEILMLLR